MRLLWNAVPFLACVAAGALTASWRAYVGVCLLLAVVNLMGYAEGRSRGRDR